MVQAAAEVYSYLLLGEAKDSDLPKPQDAERSWQGRGKGGQPDGGGMERREEYG